jgi:hypothetical protein
MIKRWESHRIPLAKISLISLKIAVLCRYDGGADIIGYDSCDSSADPSTNDHTDYRPNYCPTKTRKISTTDPNDGDFVDWTANSIADQVYAIEISTTDSK